jgi:hypothetical protein
VHDTLPPTPKRPGLHGVPVGDVSPASHPEPGGARHEPEHEAEVAPVALPKRPTGHGEQLVEPVILNSPAGHVPPHAADDVASALA